MSLSESELFVLKSLGILNYKGTPTPIHGNLLELGLAILRSTACKFSVSDIDILTNFCIGRWTNTDAVRVLLYEWLKKFATRDEFVSVCPSLMKWRCSFTRDVLDTLCDAKHPFVDDLFLNRNIKNSVRGHMSNKAFRYALSIPNVTVEDVWNIVDNYSCGPETMTLMIQGILETIPPRLACIAGIFECVASRVLMRFFDRNIECVLEIEKLGACPNEIKEMLRHGLDFDIPSSAQTSFDAMRRLRDQELKGIFGHTFRHAPSLILDYMYPPAGSKWRHGPVAIPWTDTWLDFLTSLEGCYLTKMNLEKSNEPNKSQNLGIGGTWTH